MSGPKTNERPGTRAQGRYLKGSASKARRVLNLIRNESVEDARTILQFSETGVSEVISKILESAVANASHNDGISDDELYVAACYADEGATMKRFRPRARGRASRINKRTSHVTIIVARYDADDLDARREKAATQGSTSAAQAEARRRRVQLRRKAPTTPPQRPRKNKNGPESKPVRLPPRYHHRVEEPLVRNPPGIPRSSDRRLDHSQLSHDRAAACCDQPSRS